jgi:kynurenine formamidase
MIGASLARAAREPGIRGRIAIMTSKTLAAVVLACALPACRQASSSGVAPFPAGDLVDLSHAYDASTLFWPTALEGFKLEKVADGMTPGGYYYAANNFCTAEHGGTHLDAPVHFAAGHQAVDQIPLDRLIGPAIVIDVTAASAGNADYQVTTEDFFKWEGEHGPIPGNAIVLLRTGFSRRWPDAQKYFGTAERGEAAVPRLHFPGLHPDAARWLVANRPIKAIGIDTASIDYGQSTLFESHRVLYDQNIPAFENRTSLERLPITGAHLIALPMKIGGGSGAPLRAVAILP